MLWTFNAPRDTQWSAYGMATKPTIEDGVAVYSGGYFWHNRVYLFGVDIKTGNKIWKSEAPIAQFKVEKGIAYAITSESMYRIQPGKQQKSRIVAYDVKTGKELWSREMFSEYQPAEIIGVATNVYLLTDYNKLTALEKNEGQVAWETTVPLSQNKRGTVPLSAVSVNDELFMSMGDGSMCIFDGIHGRVEERVILRPLSPNILRLVTSSGDRVLVIDGDGYVTLFNPESKTLTSPLQISPIATKPILQEDVLYYSSFQPEDPIRAEQDGGLLLRDNMLSLDARPTGQAKKTQSAVKNEAMPPGKYFACAFNCKEATALWKTEIKGLVKDAPVVADDSVLLSTNDGLLYALEKDIGKVRWTFDTKSNSAVPAYLNGTVFVNGTTELLAIDLKSGKEVWSVKPNSYSPTDKPVVVDSVVYMVAQDSNLYAIKTDPVAQNDPSQGKKVGK